MADMKISDLPLAPNVNDAQQFEVNDSGTSRRVTFQQLRTRIREGLDTIYAHQSHAHDDRYAYKNHLHDAAYSKTNHTHPATAITNSTPLGRAVLTASSPDAVRGVIGAGTGNSNLQLGTTATTAKPGNWKPHVANDTNGQLPWARLSGIPTSVTEGHLPQPLGVGSYVLARPNSGTINAGATAAGSALRAARLYHATGYEYASFSPDGAGTSNGHPPPSLTGTWRNMGGHPVNTGYLNGYPQGQWALFLRIA